MSSPLLLSAPVPNRGRRGCLSALWSWVTGSSNVGTSHAETVMMLKNVIREIQLAMNSVEHQIELKKQQIVSIMHNTVFTAAEAREMARSTLKTVRQQRTQYMQWHRMCETVGQLKNELVAQQQSLTVFSAFNRANDVMERIAQELNVDNLNTALSKLQDNLDNGREISELLSSPGVMPENGDDDDELDAELQEMVRQQDQEKEHVPSTITTATTTNEEKKTKTKKKIAQKTAVLV